MRFFRCCTHVNFAFSVFYVSDTVSPPSVVCPARGEARRGDGNRTSRAEDAASVSSVTESNWSSPEQLKTKHCYDTHDTHRPPHCAEQAVVTLVSRLTRPTLSSYEPLVSLSNRGSASVRTHACLSALSLRSAVLDAADNTTYDAPRPLLTRACKMLQHVHTTRPSTRNRDV